MARKEERGGRHASVNCDRGIRAAANAALAELGGIRLSYGRVLGFAGGRRSGSWCRRKATQMCGGIAVRLYGDSTSVEAVVYLPHG